MLNWGAFSVTWSFRDALNLSLVNFLLRAVLSWVQSTHFLFVKLGPTSPYNQRVSKENEGASWWKILFVSDCYWNRNFLLDFSKQQKQSWLLARIVDTLPFMKYWVLLWIRDQLLRESVIGYIVQFSLNVWGGHWNLWRAEYIDKY